jgi:hypothetical protein
VIVGRGGRLRLKESGWESATAKARGSKLLLRGPFLVILVWRRVAVRAGIRLATNASRRFIVVICSPEVPVIHSSPTTSYRTSPSFARCRRAVPWSFYRPKRCITQRAHCAASSSPWTLKRSLPHPWLHPSSVAPPITTSSWASCTSLSSVLLRLLLAFLGWLSGLLQVTMLYSGCR